MKDAELGEADPVSLQLFWRMAGDLAVVVDPQDRILAIAPSAAALLGSGAENLEGAPVAVLAHDGESDTLLSALAAVRGAGSHAFELCCRHETRDFRWIAFQASASQGSVVLCGRDVTEDREAARQVARAQAALRQVQKMEAIGQLTAGVAHGFNNMLAAVVGSLDLLGRRIPADDARARRHVDNAMEGARRAATLTQRLLAFSRQQTLDPASRDVNALVEDMVEILRHTLSGRIRLVLRAEPALWPCYVDGEQLEAAILNLAVNARDAMPQGGEVTVETRNADAATLLHLGERTLATDRYVLVSVRDEGEGMEAEVVAKAFDPFFTTKELGKGTGLGLSQVYGFVRQSGGHVRIVTAPGSGTAVHLYLPRMARAG